MAFTFHLFVSGQLCSVTFICYSYGCTRELVTEDITPVNFGIQFFILLFISWDPLPPAPLLQRWGPAFREGGGVTMEYITPVDLQIVNPNFEKGGRGDQVDQQRRNIIVSTLIKASCEITGRISSVTSKGADRNKFLAISRHPRPPRSSRLDHRNPLGEI